MKHIATFTIPGPPVPQGSMTAFRVGNHVRVTHKNPKNIRDYRAAVMYEASKHFPDPVHGAIFIDAVFHMPRIKGDFGTGKNEGQLKPSAPTHPTKRPDLDKLTRCLLDALQGGGVFVDDSQVVEFSASKVYANPTPKTVVAVYKLEDVAS